MAQLYDKERQNKSDARINKLHKKVAWSHKTFEDGGEKFFQLDTYGDGKRENPDKLSQTIQLDEKMARKIIDLLNDAFPNSSVNSKSNHSKYPLNRIVFGAPGTGKSFKLQNDIHNFINDNNEQFERITFHPDYTYSQFIGAYKPVSEKGNVVYKFVPGPFLRVYVKALKNVENPHILLIEEINRARVAAVFGDVFQLLDRDGNGESTYSIQTSEDIRNYLAKELNASAKDCTEIRLPNNMFIWATMNSADQGVFPMDTAFKRRWSFEYINIDDAEEKLPKDEIKIGENTSDKYCWNHLRKAINNNLIDNGINEDKLLGPFFLSEKTLKNAQNDSKSFNESFKNKVIMYLFEDVMKMRPSKLFNEKIDGMKLIYSDICKKFDDLGINIFNDKIVDEVKRLKNEKNVANQSGGQLTSTTVDDNQGGTSI